MAGGARPADRPDPPGPVHDAEPGACGAAGSSQKSLPRGRALGRGRRRAEAVRRLAEVGITDPAVADRYPFQLSGGMRQRVAIAAALARDPQVLIADEPSTALDVATQRDILALIKRVQQARGMGLVLITHDLRVAFAMCDRIYVLYAGSLLETAPASELEAEPLHPYSHGLLLSEPPADRRVTGPGLDPRFGARRLTWWPGSCPFAPRCRWAARRSASRRRRRWPRSLAGPVAAVGLHPAAARSATEMASLRERAEQDATAPASGPAGDAAHPGDATLRKVFKQGGRR